MTIKNSSILGHVACYAYDISSRVLLTFSPDVELLSTFSCLASTQQVGH